MTRDLTTEIAEVLQVENINKLNARIMGMKLSPACGRCGGSGQYSFNQIDGSTCYGCSGAGHKKPAKRDLPGVLNRAKEAVEAGELDAYLQRLRDAAFIRKASKIILDVWGATKIAKANPSHMLDDSTVEGAPEVRATNSAMHAQYARWEAVQYDKTIDATAKAELVREVIENIKALDWEPAADFSDRVEAAMEAQRAKWMAA